MANPYKTRVDARAFLNLPGFHGSAFVFAYVEDTSNRTLERTSRGRLYNPEPRLVLEIADCSERIALEFEIGSPLHRKNAFHKIDTLIEALEAFRAGLAAECRLYRARERAARDGEGAEGQEESARSYWPMCERTE